MAMKLTYEWADSETIMFTLTEMNSSYNTTKITMGFGGQVDTIPFSVTGYLSTWSANVKWDMTDTPTAGIVFTFKHYYTVNGTTTSESASVTVYIEAIGSSYTVKSYTITNSSDPLDEKMSISDNIPAYTVYRYSIVFADSGTVTFESYDTTDSIWARLSTSTSYNSDTGMPDNWLAQDYDSNGDIYISCSITAGTTYYLYVRENTEGEGVYSRIYIYPPGTSGGSSEVPTEWTVTPVTLSNISTTKSYEVGFNYGKVLRYSLTFTKSGDVTFYTTGSEIDTVAYFAEASQYSLEFNTIDGCPEEFQYYNDDISSENRNFSITAPVEAYTTYYLYIRGINLESSGNCMLYIEPDFATSTTWTLSTDTCGQIGTSGFYGSRSISAGYVYRYSMTFSSSGTATFYTSGSTYTYIYLSTTTGFDEDDGVPTAYKLSDSGANASVSYEVATGTTYYLWVRGSNISSTGSTSVGVSFETEDPSGSAVITSVSTTNSSITVKITGLDTNYSGSDRTIYWYYGTSTSSYTQSGTSSLAAYASSSSNYTFSGLSSNTTYYIYAKITYSGGSKTLSTVSFTTSSSWTQTYVQSISNISNTNTLPRSISAGYVYRYNLTFAESGTATFYSTGSIDTYGSLSLTNYFNVSTGNPSSPEVSNDDGGDDRNFKFTYDVTAGTTYYLWVRAYNISVSGSISVYIVPPSSTTKPDYFSWTYAKIKGATFNLTAAEWNALQSKVNEVREYHGLPTYSLTNVTKGNTFYASDYDNLLMAIAGAYESLGTTGVYNENAVYSEDTITADCLNKLVTLTNDLIDA